MKAALFDLRCFSTKQAKFPCFVIPFIIYGTSSVDIETTGTRYFEWYIETCAPGSGKVHRTGPQFILPNLKSVRREKGIDWIALANIVKGQEVAKHAARGSCVFINGPESAVISAGAIELGNDLIARAKRRKSSKQFYYVGSAFRQDLFERCGDIFIIKAVSLEEASGICVRSAGFNTLTEWCPTIYPADGYGAPT